MELCFDCCNNMVKFEYVILEYISKDIIKDRQENIEFVFFDLVDVNIDRFFFEKIRFLLLIVFLEMIDVDINFVVRIDELLLCV